MKIPDKVKIGGLLYKVNVVDEVCENDSRTVGKILYDKQEIRIKRGLKSEYQETIFLHELIHGIYDFCAFEQNEAEVQTITNALYQVLKDNKISFN